MRCVLTRIGRTSCIDCVGHCANAAYAAQLGQYMIEEAAQEATISLARHFCSTVYGLCCLSCSACYFAPLYLYMIMFILGLSTGAVPGLQLLLGAAVPWELLSVDRQHLDDHRCQHEGRHAAPA
jgi:hypothetical protein